MQLIEALKRVLIEEDLQLRVHQGRCQCYVITPGHFYVGLKMVFHEFFYMKSQGSSGFVHAFDETSGRYGMTINTENVRDEELQREKRLNITGSVSVFADKFERTTHE